MKTLLLLLPLLLTGCRSSGVLQMSPDTYLITKRSGAGMFANVPGMKAEVIQQANAFAATKGQRLEPIGLTESTPTHGFPSVTYQFRLVPAVTNLANPTP